MSADMRVTLIRAARDREVAFPPPRDREPRGVEAKMSGGRAMRASLGRVRRRISTAWIGSWLTRRRGRFCRELLACARLVLRD